MAPLFRLLIIFIIHLLVAGYHSEFYGVLASSSSSWVDVNEAAADSIEGGLKFDREPEDVIVARNQSLRLDCLIHGNNSAFTIVWFQDGIPIQLPDQRRQLLLNGSLFFDKVLPKRSGRIGSDEGVYYCMATHSGSGAFISRNASVRTAALGRDFTSWPSDFEAEVGDVARFECRIESVPEPFITWEKDGEPVLTAFDSRFISPKMGVLHIYDLSINDTGNYRCVANNILIDKERKSPSGRLQVKPSNPDRFLQEPRFLSPPATSPNWIDKNGNVTLECLVTGHPATSLRWSVNRTTPAGLVSQRGYLMVSTPGNYTCTAVGRSGVFLERTFQVQEALSANIIRRPKSQVFPTARTVRFECEVSGWPIPEIQWLKDGRLVPIGGRIKNRLRNGGYLSELVLSNTVTSDSGIYQCKTMNQAGSAFASARLLVNLAEGTWPEPPSNLRAIAMSPTEVLITWDPPSNVPIDDIKAYTIHYMPLASDLSNGGEEHQNVALIPSHRIDNLKRNVSYSFYIRAYVRKSASDPSDKLIFNPSDADSASGLLPVSSTPPPFPSPTVQQPRPPPRTLSPPGPAGPNLTLVALSPTQLKVSWRKGGAPVVLYKIQYRKHRAKEFDIEVVKGDVYEYVITGLHPGRKYDVRVVPGSMNAAGPWFTKEMPRVTTNGSFKPPSELDNLSPPAVELLVTNTSSVRVTWEDIGRRRADDVRLTYRELGSRDTSPVLILPPSGSQWITDLDPATVYEFQLACSFDGHQGPASQVFIQTLSEEEEEGSMESSDLLLDAGPIVIEPQVLSSNELHLTWRPLVPGSYSSNILYYTLRFATVPEEPILAPPGSASSTSPARVGYLRSTVGHAQLINLTAYTLYHFSVRSHDSEGRSSLFSSPPVEARTLPAVPTQPRNPSWQPVTSSNGSAVQLNWWPPLSPNGIINAYAILISTDPLAPIETWVRHIEAGPRLRAILADLSPGREYHIRIQAKNPAGWSALSEPLAFNLPNLSGTSQDQPTSETPPPDTTNEHEQYLGVAIGLAVGLGFAIICALIMVWRSRCVKRLVSERRACVSATTTDSHGAVLCNGNGIHHQSTGVKSSPPNVLIRFWSRPRGARERRDQDHQQVEMEAFVPMLPTLPVDELPQLDTKGGYPSVSRVSSRANDSLHSDGSIRAEVANRIPNETAAPTSDSTLLSQNTETTCLSLDYTGRNYRRRRRRSSSHGSSLPSFDDVSDQDSSRSLSEHDDNNAETQLNDPSRISSVVA